MLPKDQIDNIKKQLISQIENSNLPNKEELKKSITLMNDEQLEQFLIQNKMMKADDSQPSQTSQSPPSPPQCIFCSIIDQQIPSYILDENKYSIAVLELNPISKAHSIVIPKKHLASGDKIPASAFSLAKKIATKIKTKFKPKEVSIYSTNLFGHEIINILPIYKDENPNSQRAQATEEQLTELQNALKKKPKAIRKPKVTKIKETKMWIPRRIP